MMTRLAALVLTLLIAAGPVHAQESFFSGKRLTMLIGFTSGGGVDLYGRLVARHLSKQLAGEPAIVPQNMPGAAGVTALRSLMGAQPKDGTVIATFTPNLLVDTFTKDAQINFSKLSWVGSVGQDQRLCYMWHTTGIATWADMLKRSQIAIGDTGGDWTVRALKKLLGAPVKIVLGYPGSAEKRLAIERGELDGDCSAVTAIPSDWIAEQKIKTLVRYQIHEDVLSKGSILAADVIAHDKTKSQVLELLNTAASVGRPFVLAQEVPRDRVEVLRAAFQRMVADSDFKADAEKAKVDATPKSGAALQKDIDALYATSPAVLAMVKETMAD